MSQHNFYLTKVNKNMHIQEPVENFILWKTAWANLSKPFTVCSRDIYHAKKHKKMLLQSILREAFFSPRLTGLLMNLIEIVDEEKMLVNDPLFSCEAASQFVYKPDKFNQQNRPKISNLISLRPRWHQKLKKFLKKCPDLSAISSQTSTRKKQVLIQKQVVLWLCEYNIQRSHGEDLQEKKKLQGMQ